MRLKLTLFPLGFVLVFLIGRLAAQLPLPQPSTTPLPSPTPLGNVTIIYPTPTPNPAVPTAEQSIPVVVTYGDGTQTNAQIVRGIMQPIGIPGDRPVTVTLFLGSTIPGTVVNIGLYDGGQFAPTLPLPSPTPIGSSLADPITVAADQTVRFSYQAGRSLGLYRILLTIGPKQYLIQLYAVKPRAVTNLFPTPAPITTPPPDAPAP